MPTLSVSAAASDAAMDLNNKKLKKAAQSIASMENRVGAKEEKAEKKKMKKEKKNNNKGIYENGGVGSGQMDSKKRKVMDEEDERSGTSSEHGSEEEVVTVKKKARVVKVEEEEEEEEVSEGEDEEEEDPNALSNFKISPPLVEKLKSKGIKALFPIQAMTFDTILGGTDLVGRARTGQGKTLAFVLPILESLTNGLNKTARKTGFGRTPSVLVLLPTRELANQVFADFDFYGSACGLCGCCLYGGSPYRPQEYALKKGVDIVVGTPGRVKDHIQRGTLDLKSLKFRVLDEADEMLNMGFVDDVELILQKVEDANQVQTLLFSATLPEWVNKLSSRFLKSKKKIIDLVGNEKLKASASVRHLVLPCSHNARAQIIPDLIRCYSGEGRTIVFTETKDSASGLAGLLAGSRALHGDIVQAQREVILAGFRAGKFLVLVATNVAARGLDINDVQLIIQCEPPRDVEAYIHRSGRTGRAGNTGVAVLLYEPKLSYAISKIERETGVKFERISAPQPVDIANSAGSLAADSISGVSDSVVPVFRPQAEELLSSSGLPAVDLLAKALAKAAGYTDIKTRSLLSSTENSVTLILTVRGTLYTPSYAYGVLRRFMPDEKVEGLKGLCLTANGTSAVFDVTAEDVELFLEGQENASNVSIEILKELPPLKERDQSRGFGGRGGSDGRNGGGHGFSRRGGGRGGSFSGRGGGGRGGGNGRNNGRNGGFSNRGGGANRFGRW